MKNSFENSSASPKTEKEERSERGERLIGFLEKIHAREKVQELISGEGYISEKISFDDFLDFLVRINGILREIPIARREVPTTEVVLESAFGDKEITPLAKDKVALFRCFYDALDAVSNKADLAYLLPLSIGAIHLFPDGNGRTARALHLLARPGLSAETFHEELERALGEDGRMESIDPSSELVNLDALKIVLIRHGARFVEEGVWSPVPGEDIRGLIDKRDDWDWRPKAEWARELRSLYKSEGALVVLALSNFLKEKGVLAQCVEVFEGGRKTIALEAAERFLSDEEGALVLEKCYQIKREQVEVMIDSFVHPETHMTLDGKSTIRDAFIRKVEQGYDTNKGWRL